MNVRGVIAVTRNRLLALTRSPIALVTCAGYAVVASSFPDVDTASRVDRIRQLSCWLASAAGAFLYVSALLVPLARDGPALRTREARVLGRVGTGAAHGVASLLFLAFLSGLFGLVAWGVVSWHARGGGLFRDGPIVREVVFRNASPWMARPGETMRSGAVAIAVAPTSLSLELSPSIRVLDRQESTTRSIAPTQAMLEVTWRSGARTGTRRLPLEGSMPIVVPIEMTGAGGASSIELGIRVLARDIEVVFAPGGIVALGVGAPLFSTLLRAILVLCGLAGVLAAFTQWLSGFVRPALALLAAATVVCAVVVVGALMAESRSPWAAILELPDPVLSLRRAQTVGWGVAGATSGAAAITILLGALAAARPSLRSTA